jgi:hypothetical protein
LEDASNRVMSSEHRHDVERAISDVQLLGSVLEVRLADEFAQSFARDGHANLDSLLEALRRSLREELLLGSVPTNRVILRVTDSGSTASNESSAWGKQREDTARAVNAALLVGQGETGSVGIGLLSDGSQSAELRSLARDESPAASMDAGLAQVRSRLEALVATEATGPADNRTSSELVREALESGLIDNQLAVAIRGLGVLRHLAEGQPGGPDVQEADEFSDLVVPTLFALDVAVSRRPPGG